MKKIKNWLVRRLPLAVLAILTPVALVSCENSPPATVVHVHYPQPRPAPAYTQSREWHNGQLVRKVQNVQAEYNGYNGASEWRGQWVDDYGRQVAYGNGYRNAGGQYYCQQPPRPVYRQQYQQPVYRQPVQYCQPAPPCSAQYGTSSGYGYGLPPATVYQYHRDPSGGRNPDWRNPYSGYAPYSRPSPYGGVRF